MNLRAFQGRSMAEALSEVKRAYGSEAVILHTREVRGSGVLGRGGRVLVEITAARDISCLPPQEKPARVRRTNGIVKPVEGAASAMPGADMGTDSRSDSALALSRDVGEIKSAVATLVAESRRQQRSSWVEPLVQVHQELIAASVAEEIADDLVRRIQTEVSADPSLGRSAMRCKLASFIESMLPIAGPVKLSAKTGPTVIALVGPTGVGKTTTIAKLAANYQLRHNRRVGLVTLDTRRIAAVDQLRTYAKAIDVPLKTAATREDVSGAIRSLSRCEIVLIDTPGCSWRDRNGLAELKDMLDASRAKEIHLVLPATHESSVLRESVEGFKILGSNRVILTKLDEAVGFGVVLNCLCQVEARLSYVTTGQSVPEDIEVGRAKSLASLIVDGAKGISGRSLMHGRKAAAVAR